MSLPPSLWKVRYWTLYVWAWPGTSYLVLYNPPNQCGSIEFDNRSLVVVEIFNASCSASETRAFIFLNACSTCVEEYQKNNIFRPSVVPALALKYIFGRTWLVTSFSWCILPFPFMVFREPHRLGLPETSTSSFFFWKSNWPTFTF